MGRGEYYIKINLNKINNLNKLSVAPSRNKRKAEASSEEEEEQSDGDKDEKEKEEPADPKKMGSLGSVVKRIKL